MARETKVYAPTRDTHTNWTTNNPIVPIGVVCYTTDRTATGSVEYFMGDGTSTYSQLSKFGNGVTDEATTTTAGLMSASDKVKINNLNQAVDSYTSYVGATGTNTITITENNLLHYISFASGIATATLAFTLDSTLSSLTNKVVTFELTVALAGTSTAITWPSDITWIDGTPSFGGTGDYHFVFRKFGYSANTNWFGSYVGIFN